MEIRNICVLGGSGFVGRYLVRLLSARGFHVVVPTRSREHAKELILLPTVDVVEEDIHDPAVLQRLTQTDAVINLVGVLHNGRGTESFAEAHVVLARKIVAVCRSNGSQRLLQMSALNAAVNGSSEYLRTKGEAEAIVKDSGLEWTIFRPSVIFGRGDRFIGLFAKLLKYLPFLILGSPAARFQPVFVEDVAQTFMDALDNPYSYARSYDLCGPHIYTLRKLIELVGQWSGHSRPIFGLNATFSYAQAALLERLPGKFLTRDNYCSMQTDNVCNGEFPFGRVPRALEAIVPLYLGKNHAPRDRYADYRRRHDAP